MVRQSRGRSLAISEARAFSRSVSLKGFPDGLKVVAKSLLKEVSVRIRRCLLYILNPIQSGLVYIGAPLLYSIVVFIKDKW